MFSNPSALVVTPSRKSLRVSVFPIALLMVLRSRRRIGDRDQFAVLLKVWNSLRRSQKGEGTGRVSYRSPVFFEIAKEEGPVPFYGTSDRSAKLVQIERRLFVPNPVLEEIVGVEILVRQDSNAEP